MAPQGSLFSESEVHHLTVDLRLDEIAQVTQVSLRAMSRNATVIRSSGVVANGIAQCELIPIMLAEAAYGWLYRGAAECTTLPAAEFRRRRASLSELPSLRTGVART